MHQVLTGWHSPKLPECHTRKIIATSAKLENRGCYWCVRLQTIQNRLTRDQHKVMSWCQHQREHKPQHRALAWAASAARALHIQCTRNTKTTRKHIDFCFFTCFLKPNFELNKNDWNWSMYLFTNNKFRIYFYLSSVHTCVHNFFDWSVYATRRFIAMLITHVQNTITYTKNSVHKWHPNPLKQTNLCD